MHFSFLIYLFVFLPMRVETYYIFLSTEKDFHCVGLSENLGISLLTTNVVSKNENMFFSTHPFFENLTIPQHTYHTVQQSCSLLWYLPRGLKTSVHTKTCTRMVIAALFIIAETWKQPKCPSVSE